MRYALIVLFATLCLFVSTGCGNKTEAPAPTPATAVVAAPAPAPVPPPVAEKTSQEVVAEFMANLDKANATALYAFNAAAPFMGDSIDETSTGAALFAVWGAKSLKFSDVEVAVNETNFPLIQKDSETERGKRLCIAGTIIQIDVEKTSRGKLANGLLNGVDHYIYRFSAAKSSGTLLANDVARFCGFVTENLSYKQNGGSTGVAVTLVGMFDLPENRTPSNSVSTPDSLSTAPTP